MKHNSYNPIIKSYGIGSKERYPWIYSIKENHNLQGWKLHLSSTPILAIKLLNKVLPFLKQNAICFKVINNSHSLFLLNSGFFGSKQVGKFMTIYPLSTKDAVSIAKKLKELTVGFEGPQIDTDLKIGDITYTRYGAISPVVTYNEYNEEVLKIRSASGALVPDLYKTPQTMRVPFAVQKVDKNEKLLSGKYLITKKLAGERFGCVFQAIDLEDQSAINIKIIKEGRFGYLSNEDGTDAIDLLKNEFSILKQLSKQIFVPRVKEFFEERDRAYLVREFIIGEDMHSLIRPWSILNKTDKIKRLELLLELIRIVIKLHELGFVHRDIKPSNILVSNGKLFIIDFENTYNINSGAKWLNTSSIYFSSPQQEAGNKPDFSDDIFAMGVLSLHFLTGLNPAYYFLTKQNTKKLSVLFGNELPQKLIQDFISCCSLNKSKRVNLEDLFTSLQTFIERYKVEPQNNLNSAGFSKKNEDIHITITRSINGLRAVGKRDYKLLIKNNLYWYKKRWVEDTLVHYEAYDGLAGALYLYSIVVANKVDNNDSFKKARLYANELLNSYADARTASAGLYTGLTGKAVALLMAADAGIIKYDTRVHKFIELTFKSKTHGFDIIGGLAGQVLGLINLYKSTFNKTKIKESISVVLDRSISRLVEKQNKDGSWYYFNKESGSDAKIRYTGFAHGTAGILYALAEYQKNFNTNKINKTIIKGTNWLLDNSISNKYTIKWPIAPEENKTMLAWCHGSPGIGMTFLKLYEITKSKKYKEIAEKALDFQVESIINYDFNLCHGLSGIGEIFLYFYNILGEEKWLNKAKMLYNRMSMFTKSYKNNSILWPSDNINNYSSLMLGASGITHFLINLQNKGELPFPFL